MPDASVRITFTPQERARRRHLSEAEGRTVGPATWRATPTRCGSSLHHTAWLAGHFLPLLLGAAVCALPVDVRAAADTWTPSTLFLQAGTAGHARQLTAGLRWDWARQWRLGPGRLTGSNEGSVSAWSFRDDGGRSAAWLGQFGVIPVLRYRPSDGSSPWFVEGGVGVTLTTTLYQTQHKRFSTHFNFGDHVAAGRNFGPGRSHELALRIEHYSNAGIKRPNPGENFIQLRYAYRLH